MLHTVIPILLFYSHSVEFSVDTAKRSASLIPVTEVIMHLIVICKIS